LGLIDRQPDYIGKPPKNIGEKSEPGLNGLNRFTGYINHKEEEKKLTANSDRIVRIK
jgi:hypothetical protein